MPPKRSKALIDFRASISIAQSLINEESRFPDPPPARNMQIVQGLRGGAVVLIVAAFENFLKELIEERLYIFTLVPLQFNVNNLPEEMIYHNLNQTLERSLKGPFPINYKRSDKILGYRQASKVVIQETINLEVFSSLAKNNPNSKKVKELFKSLGIIDIFDTIKPKFDTKWGGPTAHTFISDTLDSIIQRRHEVAHTAKVLNVSRLDLHESVRFIQILATLCDEEFGRHIRKILK